jgi:hypothetical protein
MTHRDTGQLDAETRALIDAARDMHDPAHEQRVRTLQGLEDKLAAGAAAGVLGGSLPAAAKIALLVLGLGAISSGGLWLGHHASEPHARGVGARPQPGSTHAPTAAPEAATAPINAPTATTAPITAPPTAAANADHQPRETARAQHAANPLHGTTSLDRETTLLRAVNGAINAGDGARALRLLAEYDQRFAAGILREERAAAAVLALCQVGRLQDGRAAATRFAASYPRSPLLRRVDTACGSDGAVHAGEPP